LGFSQKRAWVDLSVIRQVQGDVTSPAENRVLGQLSIEILCCPSLLSRGKLAPRLAQLASQRRARKAFGYDHEMRLPSMPLPA